MWRCIAVLVAVAAACDASHAGPPSQLVTVVEGQALDVELEDAGALVSGPPWAALDGATLRLAPGCDAVSGTDGAPALARIELAHRVVLVHVMPSGAGLCMPRVIGCIVPSCSQACDPATAASPGDTLSIDYTAGGTFSALTAPPQQLRLQLANPDPTDVLATRPITDAPVPLAQVEGAPRFTAFCGPLANRHIVGAFAIDASIVRPPPNTAPSPASPFVAGGSIALAWNAPQPYGVEITSCAVDAGRCCVRYDGDRVVIEKPAASQATLWLQIWTAPVTAAYALTLDAPDRPGVVFTRSTLRASPVIIPVQPVLGAGRQLEVPKVTADLGAAPGSFTVTLVAAPAPMFQLVVEVVSATSCT